MSGHTITFGELVDGTRRLAAGLSRRGVRQGDVVAIWSPNLPEYAVVFHAVSRMGAILTTVNPVYTAEELAFQLRDAGARLLVTTGALLERAREAVAATGRDDRHRHHRCASTACPRSRPSPSMPIPRRSPSTPPTTWS